MRQAEPDRLLQNKFLVSVKAIALTKNTKFAAICIFRHTMIMVGLSLGLSHRVDYCFIWLSKVVKVVHLVITLGIF